MTTQPASERPWSPPERAVVLAFFLLAAGVLLWSTAGHVPLAVWFVRPVAWLLVLLSWSAFSPRRRHWAAEALIGSSVLLSVLAYALSDLSTMLPAAAGAAVLAVAGVVQWVLTDRE